MHLKGRITHKLISGVQVYVTNSVFNSLAGANNLLALLKFNPGDVFVDFPEVVKNLEMTYYLLIIINLILKFFIVIYFVLNLFFFILSLKI